MAFFCHLHWCKATAKVIFARIWYITNPTAARRVSPPWIVYMAKLTPTERITTKLCTQAHIPTPRYGQYLRHAHNHITPAVAAMDSCFALIGAHQHGIAVGSMGGGKTRASKTFWAQGSIFPSHLHTHAVGEPFCGSQPTDTTCLRWSWRLMKCFAFASAVEDLKCDPTATPCWWAPTMAKPLSVAAPAWVIWLCTCTRSWYVCFSDWYWGENPVWQTGLATSVGHQTYHVNVNKLKWEIIWTGGLPHLSGLPHLPEVPHLHVNRP